MFQNNLILGASGNQGFYPTELEQSLRFNDDDSAYLSWTPASAGNRKTWTWSGWVKRGAIARGDSKDYPLFASRPAAGTYTLFTLRHDSAVGAYGILFDNSAGGSYATSMKLRDTSAWYHIQVAVDTTQATTSNRVKIYVNGVLQTSFDTYNTAPSQNADTNINTTTAHNIGRDPYDNPNIFDGYLAEVNFIDGQALDPTSFGEFKSGVWVANEYTGSYGTNGFYLPFKQTTVANGFNAVTYTTNNPATNHAITGVGFQPDLIWTKSRTQAYSHYLFDSVRGTGANALSSNRTDAEGWDSTVDLVSFDADGFTAGPSDAIGDTSGVAWCWDAGSGSPVSNTDGSITSSVKANSAYGFSVVSYTDGGTYSDTIGHGLSQKPDLYICKTRSTTSDWFVFTDVVSGSWEYLRLNTTGASTGAFQSANSTTFNPVGISGSSIAYCFAEISGYSKISSYSGTGASGNTITTGFKPAFVMIKRTDSAENWIMYDNTRAVTNPIDKQLLANSSNSEINGYSPLYIDFNSNGFTINGTNAAINASGGTYIYMAFADTRDAAFWRDLSGNDNTWQPNALQNSDVMPDSPTNNFATLNPLDGDTASYTLSEGNLKSVTANSGYGKTASTIGMSSGKWYWEVYYQTDNGTDNCMVGIANQTALDAPNHLGATSQAHGYFAYNGNHYDNGVSTAYGSVFGVGSIVGVLLDVDAGTLTFYKDGVSQGVAEASLASGETWFASTSDANNSVSITTIANFGQDSSFAGNKTAQGNTDDNGVGDFYYAPPSGYLALCTANLPDPVIDPAQDDVPSDYFTTVLTTGDGTNATISGFGFQPDFLWHKSRSTANNNQLMDLIRVDGSGNPTNLVSNLTNADGTSGVVTFTSDGYTHLNGSSNNFYGSGVTYVDWAWKAGNGTSSNTDGSITSTVSVNQKAGFSVVGYTGTGANATVGHGLGVAPAMVIVKNRDDADNWWVYHEGYGATKYTSLNLTDAAQTNSIAWNNTAPTSSVFSIGTSNRVNGSGDAMIAYCFAEVEGYSKFGSYTGNGSADGPFVYCGFRPSWIMVKRTDATNNWHIFDSARLGRNPDNEFLYADASDAEISQDLIDLTSNGFKVRQSGGGLNTSSASHIFMAFAEMPAKYSLGR